LTAPVFSSAYKAKSPQAPAPISSYVSPGSSVQQAEARDGSGGHHHHGHHAEHGEHHHVDHAAAAPVAAPAAPEPAYQAPVSQGNLYYYYYPVQAEPIVEKSDDELDPLVLVLLPITILVGILALISVINVSVTGRALYGSADVQGRSFPTTGRQNSLNAAFGSFDQLKAEVDRMLERYYHALENESCMDRVVCELGTKAKDLSGKNMLMTALDWIIPEHMSGRISTFKDAVNQGYEVHQCKQKFYCDSSKLIQTNRK